MKKETIKDLWKYFWFPIVVVGTLVFLVVAFVIDAWFFPPKPEFVPNQSGLSIATPVDVLLDDGVYPWLLFSEQGEPFMVFSTKKITESRLQGKLEKWGHDEQGIPLFVEIETVHATPVFREEGDSIILLLWPEPQKEK